MAISKIIYKSSAEDTGTVWMDVTQKTVTAGTMLNGTTALKNDGTDITGNIASKTSSDLTANVLTVTAPAGHYASAASKTLTDQYLLAENIKKDISIFGVTGTYEGGGGGTSWETVYNGTQSITDDWGNGKYYVMINSWGETIDLNSVWRITWDGIPYECTATWIGSPDGDPCAIGNYTYDGGTGGTDYPFFMQAYWSTDLAIVAAVSGSHTVKIEKQVPVASGLEYETGTYTPAEDIVRPTISFTNSHSDRPFYIIMIDNSSTISSLAQASSALAWGIMSYYDFERELPYSTTGLLYGRNQFAYKTDSSYSSSGTNITALTGFGNGTLSYYMDNTGFTPYLGSTSVYFRSGVTYKWIAVWKPFT